MICVWHDAAIHLSPCGRGRAEGAGEGVRAEGASYTPATQDHVVPAKAGTQYPQALAI